MTSLWVVGLSLPASPPTSSVMEAAPAAPLLPPLLLRLRRLRAARRASSGAALVASVTEVTAVSRLLSWGFSKNAPPSCSLCVHSWQARARKCQSRARSALAVLPDFSGLLHTRPCGFVAPRKRPWGPPGFQPTADLPRRNATAVHPTFPTGALPFEVFPSPVAVVLSPEPLPPRCWLGDHRSARFAPTSGLYSTAESVAPRQCCHRRLARYSLGLSHDFRLSPRLPDLTPWPCPPPRRWAAWSPK